MIRHGALGPVLTRRTPLGVVLLLASLAIGPGCDCSNPNGGGGGGDGGTGGFGGDDAGIPVPDGGFPDGGVIVTPGVDGGAPTVCQLTACPDGKLYECGDCIDNDGDGRIDTGSDPNCLGPCDNNESGYDPKLSGQPNNQCRTSCYFNANSGAGCDWNFRCDEHESVRTPYDHRNCPYQSNPNGSVHGNRTCSSIQSDHEMGSCSDCEPLVPPGCDCFGCCEIPSRSGNFVYIGSRNGSGSLICDYDSAVTEYDLSGGAGLTPTQRLAERSQNQRNCRICEPTPSCFRACVSDDPCQLCIGDTLPPECDDEQYCEGGPTCAPISNNACPTGLSCFFGCCIDINPG